MAPPAKKRTDGRAAPRLSSSERPSSARAEIDPGNLPDQSVVGEIWIDAGLAFGAVTRLRVRGLNVLAQPAVQEKEKISITLDKPLVDEIRSRLGGRALSTSINDLLYTALAQERLGELVEEMEQEAGPPSPESYERVLAQWFAQG